jgi:very-short-patch-repair endonuclease
VRKQEICAVGTTIIRMPDVNVRNPERRIRAIVTLLQEEMPADART